MTTLKIYTDASKRNGKAGIAFCFVHDNTKYHYTKEVKPINTDQLEYQAVISALIFITKSKGDIKHFVIRTDSHAVIYRTTLVKLPNKLQHTELDKIFLALHRKIKERGWTIQYKKVKREFNRDADAFAKLTTQKTI